MDCLPEGTRAFAMDDPDFVNPFFTAQREIFRQQILHLSGTEGVQIQRSVDGKLNRVRPVFS